MRGSGEFPDTDRYKIIQSEFYLTCLGVKRGCVLGEG